MTEVTPNNAAANEALTTLEGYLISRGAEESVQPAIKAAHIFIAQQVSEKQSTVKPLTFFVVLVVGFKNFMLMFANHEDMHGKIKLKYSYMQTVYKTVVLRILSA